MQIMWLLDSGGISTTRFRQAFSFLTVILDMVSVDDCINRNHQIYEKSDACEVFQQYYDPQNSGVKQHTSGLTMQPRAEMG